MCTASTPAPESVIASASSGAARAVHARFGLLRYERVAQLLPIGLWEPVIEQTDIIDADRFVSSVERAEQPIPQQKELAEVHLRVLEFALVVPAVQFRGTDQRTQHAEPIVDVGV